MNEESLKYRRSVLGKAEQLRAISQTMRLSISIVIIFHIVVCWEMGSRKTSICDPRKAIARKTNQTALSKPKWSLRSTYFFYYPNTLSWGKSKHTKSGWYRKRPRHRARNAPKQCAAVEKFDSINSLAFFQPLHRRHKVELINETKCETRSGIRSGIRQCSSTQSYVRSHT